MGHLFLMSTALQECKSQEAERGTEKSTLASWKVPHLDPCRIVWIQDFPRKKYEKCNL
jgi:hypothetical protein